MAKTEKTIRDKTLPGMANLIKLLPTGTVFLFQFLNPVFTNSGDCDHSINKHLSAILISLCGFSCAFASFTDSYTDADGRTRYGIVTRKGLWPEPVDSKSVDMSGYKIRIRDFVHAIFALLVFAVVVLLDSNTVECFYPKFGKKQNVLIQVLPVVVGAVSSSVFVLFPNTRHGIGYGNSTSTTDSSRSN